MILILFLILGRIYYDNTFINVTRYNIKNKNIPKNFNNFKIIQISDLHSRVFGKDNKLLIDKIKAEKPDIIVITGDIINKRNYEDKKIIALVSKIKNIAPIYYVNGNHESWSEKYNMLRGKLIENGVILMENSSIEIKSGNKKLQLLGINDPSFINNDYMSESDKLNQIDKTLNEISTDKRLYKILLSHRPELIELYKKNEIDLVFSGHTHGGQVRFPIIGAIIAPEQGFFPKYDKGIFNEEKTTMIVSSGLGNSVVGLRLFNPPEIVLVKLFNN